MTSAASDYQRLSMTERILIASRVGMTVAHVVDVLDGERVPAKWIRTALERELHLAEGTLPTEQLELWDRPNL